jgi:hypothetical protein
LKKHDGQAIAVGDIFEGFQYFWSAWGVGLAVGIVMVVISMLAKVVSGTPHGVVALTPGHLPPGMMLGNGITSIVGWFVGTFVLFAFPFIADGRGGAVDALTESINAAKSDYWMYFAVVVTTQILAGVGFVACCVGVFFTGALAQAVQISVYRYRFPAVGK